MSSKLKESPGIGKEFRMKSVSPHHVRNFVLCRECGRVYFYDSVKHSLSTPVLTTECGHELRSHITDGQIFGFLQLTPAVGRILLARQQRVQAFLTSVLNTREAIARIVVKNSLQDKFSLNKRDRKLMDKSEKAMLTALARLSS